ncbi:hypothetical protein MPAR168_22335 [Methylorubrum populi]|uniref:Uncharacterized protein n=1 Tax=Methylobacterium radiotolerans TaxID=31998 RepID=A0ABU7THF6_9HYPH
MNILVRLLSRIASVTLRYLSLTPKIVAFGVAAVISLPAEQAPDVSLDENGDEARRSILYRHYV